MKGEGVNRTDVFVVYNPSGAKHRAVLQVTIRPGKKLGEEEKTAISSFVETALRVQQICCDSRNR